jgi:hypothetical protein
VSSQCVWQRSSGSRGSSSWLACAVTAAIRDRSWALRSIRPTIRSLLQLALEGSSLIGMSRAPADPEVWGHVQCGLHMIASRATSARRRRRETILAPESVMRL